MPSSARDQLGTVGDVDADPVELVPQPVHPHGGRGVRPQLQLLFHELDHRPEHGHPGVRGHALSSHSGPSARTMSATCATSRDLPTPGSPVTRTPQPCPDRARAQASSSADSSADRPTSGPRRPTAGRFRPRSSRRAVYPEGRHLPGDPAEPHRPERRGVEAVVRQAHDRTAGQHGARLGEGLQAGGDVEGLAHGHGGAPVGSAELADDGGSAVHADPDRESPGWRRSCRPRRRCRAPPSRPGRRRPRGPGASRIGTGCRPRCIPRRPRPAAARW